MGAASEAFRHAYRQSANIPDGMGDGVAIDGMQQFAAAVSGLTTIAVARALRTSLVL